MSSTEHLSPESDPVTAMFDVYDQTREEQGVIPALDQMRQTLREMGDEMPWPSRFDVIHGKITKERGQMDLNDPANTQLVQYLDDLERRVASVRAQFAIDQKARLAERRSRKRNPGNGGGIRIHRKR